MRAVVVTGTGTGVGKTVVTAAVAALEKPGFFLSVRISAGINTRHTKPSPT